MGLLKGLNAKTKKHIGTIGYYAGKQAEELAKVNTFLVENGINTAENEALVASVKSGAMTAEVAIDTIDAVLATAYNEAKAIEKAAKAELDRVAKAEAALALASAPVEPVVGEVAQ